MALFLINSVRSVKQSFSITAEKRVQDSQC
jgi:hypothetical protein